MWKIFSFLKMFREDLLVMMVALKESRTPAALG
jgi:putative membrane protein